MAVIRINTVQVMRCRPKADAARQQTASVKNGVEDIRHRLDPRIKSRRNIDRRLESVAGALEKAEAQIARIAETVQDSAEGYQEVERQIERRSRDLAAVLFSETPPAPSMEGPPMTLLEAFASNSAALRLSDRLVFADIAFPSVRSRDRYIEEHLKKQ